MDYDYDYGIIIIGACLVSDVLWGDSTSVIVSGTQLLDASRLRLHLHVSKSGGIVCTRIILWARTHDDERES